MSRRDHNKISPTAWVVAHGRVHSGLPYAKEIFAQIKDEVPSEQVLHYAQTRRPAYIGFEARYRLIQSALAAEGATNILDLASGLAPRGLDMSRKIRNTVIEMDLPEIVRQKREIVDHILKEEGKQRNNLILTPGNVLRETDIMRAGRLFANKEPIAVVCEGLLRYLTMKEKTLVAKGIKKLLQVRGGVWVTPDIFTKTSLTKEIRRVNRAASQIVGANIEKNNFKDIRAAKDFFTRLGFSVETRLHREMIPKLKVVKHFKLTPKEVRQYLSSRTLFIMRLRKE